MGICGTLGLGFGRPCGACVTAVWCRQGQGVCAWHVGWGLYRVRIWVIYYVLKCTYSGRRAGEVGEKGTRLLLACPVQPHPKAGQTRHCTGTRGWDGSLISSGPRDCSPSRACPNIYPSARRGFRETPGLRYLVRRVAISPIAGCCCGAV